MKFIRGQADIACARTVRQRIHVVEVSMVREWCVVVVLIHGLCQAQLTGNNPGGSSSSDTFVKIGDSAYLSQTFFANVDTKHIKNILYPVLGCPAIVKSGAQTTIIIKSPVAISASGIFVYAHAASDKISKMYALPVSQVAFDSQYSIYKVKVNVPAMPEDVYNLKVVIPMLGIIDTQYSCLKVKSQLTNTFRYAVVSDAHFNDPRGFLNPANYNPSNNYNPYTIMKQMLKELKNQQIDFVINMGDTVFGTGYGYEYNGAWNLWKDAGVCVFAVPGNHDGQASIKKRTILGITCPKRDGLDYFRANFGPCYYSFNYGGYHFLGINSMDGTPERRDGFYIVLMNWGGDLSPAQMQFISQDLATVSSNVVPFSHHSPAGPYTPNQPFSIWSWLFSSIVAWISSGELWGFWDSPAFVQEWNSESTALFLKDQLLGKTSEYIVGHGHSDMEETKWGINFRQVTTAGSDSGTYWGYSIYSVNNGTVVDKYYDIAANKRSYPTGNLLIEETSANNATEPSATIKVTNYLTKSRDLFLEFYVKTFSPLTAENGTIVSIENIGFGRFKVRVKATIEPAATELVTPSTKTIKVKPQ